MKMKIDCIILAAGMSTRIKEWKMLLPFGESTILETCINNALNFCENVILVVGYQSSVLIEQFSDKKNVTIIKNSDYKKGMFKSVQIGVSAVTTDYFFISHGDLPLITPDIFKILSAYKGTKAVFPVNKEKRGHPVLLPKTIIEQILQEQEDSSMKELLSTYPTQLVQVNSDCIYTDIDTHEDYIRLK